MTLARREELLRRLYAAWNRGDFEALRESLHPEVEWHSSGVFPGLEPVYRGHDEVRDWWHAIKDPFDEFTIEMEDAREVDGRVVTSVRLEAVGKGSGASVKLPFAHLFEFEGDSIIRYRSFDSLEKALAEARR